MTVEIEQPPGRDPKRWLKRGLAGGVAVVVIVGTFVFVLPQFANYSEVWAQVRMLSWEWVCILLASVVLNMVTSPRPGWRRCRALASCRP